MQSSQSMTAIGITHAGYLEAQSRPKIADFFLHQSMLLVFRLIYRVQYELIEGKTEEKEFTIAYGLHVPRISVNRDDIKEESVRLDLLTGPGTTLFGEPLWDPQNDDIDLKLSFLLNSSEDNISDLEREDMMRKNKQEMERKQKETLAQ